MWLFYLSPLSVLDLMAMFENDVFILMIPGVPPLPPIR